MRPLLRCMLMLLPCLACLTGKTRAFATEAENAKARGRASDFMGYTGRMGTSDVGREGRVETEGYPVATPGERTVYSARRARREELAAGKMPAVGHHLERLIALHSRALRSFECPFHAGMFPRFLRL